MRFHYVAARPDGKIEEGDYDATAPLEVLQFLGAKGLRPISVKQVTNSRVKKIKGQFFGAKFTISDKIFLTKYLALMLRVGTDLFNAVDILIADFNKPVVKGVLVEVRAGLERGQPFYSTFAKYPKYFSNVFVNLVKAGENSGSLEKVFDTLSVSLEKEKDLKGQIRAAFIYPVILLVLSFLILIFLVTFALPKIATVFEGGSFNPPLFSRIVFAVGEFVNAHIAGFLITIVVVIGGLIFFLFKTHAGRTAGKKFVNRMPVVRVLIRKMAIQQFASTLSALMRAGLPIVESLETTADTIADLKVRDALHRVAREGISKGVTLGEAFKREPAFPSVVANLIAISEQAGHLDEILHTISEFYEKEVTAELKTLTSFIEPVLLLGIGAVVGLIALSIIVPIYQLVGQF
jgi:type II secretory pathway component PulF